MIDTLSGLQFDRRLHGIIAELLRDEPVVALHGPRTVGKSTLLHDIADAAGTQVIDLDDGATRAAVAADPSLFASGQQPVCIDEYQHEPTILDAIKAELNRDLRPGRFVLTGSTTYSSIPLTAQSLTGRLHMVTVWPLSQGEIDGVHETFVEKLISEPERLVTTALSTTPRDEYLRRITRGGFPLALTRKSSVSRNRWFDDYISLVVERDVMELSKVRQRRALPDLLAALASQSAQLLVMATAARKSGLETATAENYTKLLEASFLVHRLHAWGTALRPRIATSPKIHMVDTGVSARLLRLTPEKLALRHPTALTELGHLLENFVVNEVLKQASWLDPPPTAGHFRTKDGAEVDLVLETDDGRIIGIEVKTSGTVHSSDFAGLRSLRRVAGDAFLAGIVMHLGSRSFSQELDLLALPVDKLWS